MGTAEVAEDRARVRQLEAAAALCLGMKLRVNADGTGTLEGEGVLPRVAEPETVEALREELPHFDDEMEALRDSLGSVVGFGELEIRQPGGTIADPSFPGREAAALLLLSRGFLDRGLPASP
mmetsp:Transcript_17479/g.53506  ORF Transcript_17479/g.53506 Transcript_17479/m.53506 type:complete len:122 (-) Transcript_17479:156-521(-)